MKTALELAKKELCTTGRLELHKQCKGEYIVYVFTCMIVNVNDNNKLSNVKMLGKYKYHYTDSSMNRLKKNKSMDITCTVKEFIKQEMHELICDKMYRVRIVPFNN